MLKSVWGCSFFIKPKEFYSWDIKIARGWFDMIEKMAIIILIKSVLKEWFLYI